MMVRFMWNSNLYVRIFLLYYRNIQADSSVFILISNLVKYHAKHMMNLIPSEYPKLEYGAREIVINPHETKRSANGRIPGQHNGEMFTPIWWLICRTLEVFQQPYSRFVNHFGTPIIFEVWFVSSICLSSDNRTRHFIYINCCGLIAITWTSDFNFGYLRGYNFTTYANLTAYGAITTFIARCIAEGK